MPRNNQIVRFRAYPYRLSNRTRALARRAASRAIQYGVQRLKRRATQIVHGHVNKRRIITPNIQRALYRRSRSARRYTRVVGNAAGTTRTTSRMIVRKTPKEQRFLRKMFREQHNQVKHVQRFGFSFIGASGNNKAIWYSVTHLKFNNIMECLRYRRNDAAQNVSSTAFGTDNTTSIGNTPSNFIYLGKCTFLYELYNPTNYNMTVYIYDLICKQDTPYAISYGGAQTITTSSSPECCMEASSAVLSNTNAADGWTVADPVYEVDNAETLITDPDWRTVGMKPTDYYYFNTMWKVKGMKKIILPPQTSHHHVVIFNPKKKISLGSFLFPRVKHERSDKHGVAGLTQSTLFGIEGQVATDSGQAADNEKVGTLPGKIIIKCIRKVNTFNFALNTSTIIQKNRLQALEQPEIFTDLVPKPPDTV